MKTVYPIWGIEGSEYDGCNGWTSWICKGLLFTSKEKAQEYIDNRWGNGGYSRFTPILMDVK